MAEKKKNAPDARAAHAPRTTGVYMMKDAHGDVLYVGKAKNMRARVLSYFRDSGDGRLATTVLRNKIHTIEYVPTTNEHEALILEDTLIKEYQPKYNVELKDDRRYFSLKITAREKFPRLLAVHQRADDGSLYFGPFARGGRAKNLLRRLVTRYALRRCSHPLYDPKGPCLYAQTGGCSAPCAGNISEEEYRMRIQKIIAHLRRFEQIEQLEKDKE